MTDTATPETGPVDAPASLESVTAEFLAGGESAPDALEEVTRELVNEAEGTGDSEQEPDTEEDATQTAEDEAKDPEEGDPDEQRYTVKVNGEEREVPLSELLKGYSRTEDYKAKTAAVAQERREAEALKANAAAEAQAHFANQLEEATNLFQQYDPVLSQARQIDWNALKQNDPAAYVQAQDAVQARLNAIQQMQQRVTVERQAAEQTLAERAEAERVARFDTAASEIVKAMPELADQAKFGEFATAAIGQLRGEGFTPEEINDVLDHRVLALADKARRWEAHVEALKALPERKVVPKSAVKTLTSDGSGSSQPRSRFPANATREAKGNWIVEQILSQE